MKVKNLRVNVKNLTVDIENLPVNVENLLDKGYLAGGENGEINVGKPRTVKFGVSYKF